MGKDIENHIDWIVPTTPGGERGAGRRPAARRDSLQSEAARAAARRDVMNTLLGKNDLAAQDITGDDPYNSTGRHLRR
jgi:hypothetical protein